MGEYYVAHCSGCGEETTADLLAFDFGRLINTAIEKAEGRKLGSTSKWIPMLKLDLALYYVWRDLAAIYRLKEDEFTDFRFTVGHLRRQFEHLANVDDFSEIADLADVNNLIYNRLIQRVKTPLQAGKRATRQDIDIHDHADNIRELVELCSDRISADENEVIAEFQVKVYMVEDDQGNPFPKKLSVIYEDGEQVNIIHNVCPHCGKTFHSSVGLYKEFIICMAGSARVGKTAYLAALMDAIEQHGGSFATHVYANSNPDYRFFYDNILTPYKRNQKIPKTAFEGSGETIPLFSATIQILDRTYIFTFIDMPGEAFDSEETNSGAKFIINDRKIVQHAQMIWFCIDPQQINARVREMNQVATADDDLVNSNTRQVMENIGMTLEQVCMNEKKNAAVLITKSDLILGNSNVEGLFRPEEHAFTDYVNDGGLDFDHELQFAQKSFAYLNEARGIVATINGMFRNYTTFAVAAYGTNVSPIDVDVIQDLLQGFGGDREKRPSMVELPFLWTLAALDLIPAYKKYYETIPEKRFLGIIVKPEEVIEHIVKVTGNELYTK